MNASSERTRSLPSHLSHVLVSPEQIQDRVDELAAEISADYVHADSLLLVGILRGAFIFLADLTRRLTVPHTVDFIALSSYDKKTTSGAVRILMDLRAPVEGRDVLIVEDIIESGRTLEHLRRLLRAGGELPTLAVSRQIAHEGDGGRLPRRL